MTKADRDDFIQLDRHIDEQKELLKYIQKFRKKFYARLTINDRFELAKDPYFTGREADLFKPKKKKK